MELSASADFLIRISENIGNQVASNGGTHSNKVTNTCTHLVVTTKDFEAKSAKGRLIMLRFAHKSIGLIFTVSWSRT